ncbi:MAG: HAD family hydrolase [Candidatus Methylumidiphilus sp.]
MQANSYLDQLRTKLHQHNISHFFVDADDTLWHDAKYFRTLELKLLECCSFLDYSEGYICDILDKEKKKVKLGELGFATAVLRTADHIQIQGQDKEVLAAHIRDFLHHDLELLPYCEKALESLSMHYRLVLLTKGNTNEQQAKLNRSGLNHYFSDVIVVVKKELDTFSKLLIDRRLVGAETVSMGNSILHDIVPATNAGAIAIWMDHAYNHRGNNHLLPSDAYRIESWQAILNLLH